MSGGRDGLVLHFVIRPTLHALFAYADRLSMKRSDGINARLKRVYSRLLKSPMP